MLQERDLQLDTVAVKKTEKVPGKSVDHTVELASVSGKWNKEETELTLDTMSLTATSGKLVNTQNKTIPHVVRSVSNPNVSGKKWDQQK